METYEWKDLNNVPDTGSYLCFMEDCYVKMCYFTGIKWLDMWKLTISGKVKYWMELPNLPDPSKFLVNQKEMKNEAK